MNVNGLLISERSAPLAHYDQVLLAGWEIVFRQARYWC